MSSWLRANGIGAPPYHAQMDDYARERLEQRLLANDVKALVATVALGMGFDKPDLGFVIHYQRPGSAVAYYQQIGRAGRDLDDARVVLLAGDEDDDIAEYFIRGAFPKEETLREIVAVAEATDGGVSLNELERHVNAPRGKVQQALLLLELDGALFRDGWRWMRTVTPWQPDLERMRRVTDERRRELRRMSEFVRTDGCLMEFLARELDDPSARACGRCANCAGDFMASTVATPLVEAASRFLRRSHRPIVPRRRWPVGLTEPAGAIPPEHQLEEGRSLCVYNDGGWGRLVASAKHENEPFDDQLVDAVVAMINDWASSPAPAWVTAVPSLVHDALVPQFAGRLARRLGLPFRAAVVKTRTPQPQKLMENSAQQVKNIYGAFQVRPDEVISGEPVLLVDDIVDSRWSMTVCGVELRRAGAGAVVPVALATASLSA